MTGDEFELKLKQLQLVGFPAPVMEGHWAVSDLLDWIVMRQEEMVNFVSNLSDYIEK